jgi:thioredoxin reductase
MSSGGEYDVLIVGNGVAGLSAGMFTARQDLSTAVLGGEDSMLHMNSHLENYPGFPGGVTRPGQVQLPTASS